MRTVDSISLNSFDGEAKAAIRVMSDAMIVARSLEGRAATFMKSDTSPVTVADLAIQGRTVYCMLPHLKRFNARPEIGSDAE